MAECNKYNPGAPGPKSARAPPLQRHHNGLDGVSNHQPHYCLLKRLFRRKSKKTSKLRVTGLCVGTGEFPAQMASNAENVFIWWRHHDFPFNAPRTDESYGSTNGRNQTILSQRTKQKWRNYLMEMHTSWNNFKSKWSLYLFIHHYDSCTTHLHTQGWF